MGEADSHADAQFAAVWTAVTSPVGGLIAGIVVAPAIQDYCRTGWLAGAWETDAPVGCALFPTWMYGSSAFPTALGFLTAAVTGVVVWLFAYFGHESR